MYKNRIFAIITQTMLLVFLITLSAKSEINPRQCATATQEKQVIVDSTSQPQLQKQQTKQNIKDAGALVLDDGDDLPDSFFGTGNPMIPFEWRNEFNLSGFNFQLNNILFFMRSENSIIHAGTVRVYDQYSNIKWEYAGGLPKSPYGQWYLQSLPTPINFKSGESFYIYLKTINVGRPAGLDLNARHPNKGSYYNPQNGQYIGLETAGGCENAAFLIRAVGNVTAPTGVEEEVELPANYILFQNYPNPFNGSTTICYALAQQADVKLEVFNNRGEKVATLVDQTQNQGQHSVNWQGIDDSGASVSTGLYIYRLTLDNDQILSKKMLYMK